MRFLHTSDLHFGNSLCGQSFFPAQEKLSELILEAANEHACTGVIIAGDVFDSSLSSAMAIDIYDKLVTTLCKSGLSVIISSGNHDGAKRLSSCNRLLRQSGLYIYGDLAECLEPVKFEDCDVYAIPFCNSDTVKSVFGDYSEYEHFLGLVTAKIRGNMDKTKKNILLAHCFVVNSIVSESDYAVRVGNVDAVPVCVFEGFDYVALGHLHKGQNPSQNIRYSGTPFKYSFSEANHEKSFTIYDTETSEFYEVPIAQPMNLRVLKGKYEEILEIAANDTNRLDYMKITITDRFIGASINAEIRELYPNLLLLQGQVLEPSENSKITIKSSEINSLSTEDLARKFCSDMGDFDINNDQLKWLNEAISTKGESIQ